jgi:membrane protein YqaA with SNARE-associated domain
LPILSHFKQYLLALGIPGIFLIAFVDSAAVPLIGGPDAVVLFLSWQRPVQSPVIVLAAALGSTLGCVVLYYIGRAGGELALHKFHPEQQQWVKGNIDTNAFWAVIVAVLAPPPFPTKLVILAAGAFQMRLGLFIAGVFIGRLLRYTMVGYLGARYGGQAAALLKSEYPTISLVLIGGVILFMLVRRFRRTGRPDVNVQASLPRD